MFGKNPIRKQEIRPDDKLWVQEIFRTIQGEGPLAGQPAVFIRLAGCNLACNFCDTEFESGVWLRTDDVAAQAIHLAVGWADPLFVITGGEPLRQDIRELINMRLARVGRVQIETAGTLWIPGAAFAADIVVSPKTGKVNKVINTQAKAWKYILRAGEVDPDDGLPNVLPTGRRGRVARPPLATAHSAIYVQPCDDHDADKNRANLEAAKEVAMRFGYRLSLQQHKILELP